MTFDIGYPWVMIEGANGSGKTSLLEALHYMCYLRSFRASHSRTLIQEGQDTLFIRAKVNNCIHDVDLVHDLKVGYTGKTKTVSLDGKPVDSYKDLLATYRVVTLTDDDMALIKDGPLARRVFVDQALVMQDAEYGILLRTYRRVLEQRNGLLASHNKDEQLYDLWTQQLWEKTQAVQLQRIAWLKRIETEVNTLLNDFFQGEYVINLRYCPKKGAADMPYEAFCKKYPQLHHEENMYGYSLFGAHVDDVLIEFQNRRSRLYASRGQQKLIVVLLKLAHLIEFARARGTSLVLLDDFLTDFDQQKSERLFAILRERLVNCQFIVTATTLSFLPEYLQGSLSGCHRMRLTGAL